MRSQKCSFWSVCRRLFIVIVTVSFTGGCATNEDPKVVRCSIQAGPALFSDIYRYADECFEKAKRICPQGYRIEKKLPPDSMGLTFYHLKCS